MKRPRLVLADYGQLVTEGRSAKEIGTTLSVSARTVEFHKYQMMEKLDLHTNAELIHFALKHGIAAIQIPRWPG